MQTHTLSLNGNGFFVRSWGQPHLPKLILLHGFPEYSGAWDDLAPELSGMFHCIAPDQRGYGQKAKGQDQMRFYRPNSLGNYDYIWLVRAQ